MAETRSLPYGEERWSSGTAQTDFGFTGQRKDGFGLMDYNARYYSPYISQFTQPDTIIPEPYNPLDWNRYMYTRANPVRYTDPTGHNICDGPLGAQVCADAHTGNSRLSQPWTLDDDYDSGTHSIPNWGQLPAEVRAEKVWRWLILIGRFTDIRDLAAWLLWQEGGELLNDDVYQNPASNASRGAMLLVTYIKSRLSDGIDPASDLAKFTAFFNPDSGGAFTQGDWSELMSTPVAAAYNTVDAFWDVPYPYSDPYKNIVTVMPNETNPPGYTKHLFDVTNPVTGRLILILGLK